MLRGERSTAVYQRTERQIAVRGATIVIVGRFIRAGRTATTIACGTVSYPATNSQKRPRTARPFHFRRPRVLPGQIRRGCLDIDSTMVGPVVEPMYPER